MADFHAVFSHSFPEQLRSKCLIQGLTVGKTQALQCFFHNAFSLTDGRDVPWDLGVFLLRPQLPLLVQAQESSCTLHTLQFCLVLWHSRACQILHQHSVECNVANTIAAKVLPAGLTMPWPTLSSRLGTPCHALRVPPPFTTPAPHHIPRLAPAVAHLAGFFREVL